MAGSINRVDQDIAALEDAIAKIAQEFHHAYEVYLVALGQGVRQQLILASYHLCTQIYPQVFLELSVSQRQKLQQGLRNLARQMQTDLCESLQAPADFELEDLDDDFTSEPEEEQPEENLQVSQTPKPLTPERLFSWQDGIETGIVRLLKLLSKDTNLQLQRFGLLPKNYPKLFWKWLLRLMLPAIWWLGQRIYSRS
ncbi:hypothetical protein [Planktothrix prolifica]|uniref:hypothetical protein n=1 Tax=Planktothrix prolifica TaxID=54307 RepID=UPI00069386D5|nr:hypothetical protein [Planktothrix prolifica]